MTINVALAGAGAFGIKHLDAIKLIPGVKVVSLVSRELAKTQEVADKYGIQHVTTDLADSLAIKPQSTPSSCARRRRCTRRRRWPAWPPASMCRWRFRCATC
jgi:hypothetical protein